MKANGPVPNVQKDMDALLAQLQSEGRTPTLLLHGCCAPCSSYVLEYLSQYFFITLFFYNPNISPEEEYKKRAQEIQRLIREMPLKNPVRLLFGKYDPDRYFETVRGLESEPEGGARCRKCFELRLSESAKMTRKLGLEYFTTTLTISPLKNADVLNETGRRAAQKYGVHYLPSDFKKKNGYLRSIRLSEKYDLYRQNFCGCVFSREESGQNAEQKKTHYAQTKRK